MGKSVLSAVALAAALALGLCGCGSPQASSSTDAAADGSASAASASSSTDAAAGGSASAASASSSDVAQFATLKDAMEEFESGSMKVSSKEIMYEGSDGSNYVCVWCDMTNDKFSSLLNNDYSVFASLDVKRQEVYTPAAQSEVDALVGKTGAELEAEGFSYEYCIVHDDEGTVHAVASKAPDRFLLVFEGTVASIDDQDVAGAVKDLKVASVYVGS